jgi:hypothetical protein
MILESYRMIFHELRLSRKFCLRYAPDFVAAALRLLQIGRDVTQQHIDNSVGITSLVMKGKLYYHISYFFVIIMRRYDEP